LIDPVTVVVPLRNEVGSLQVLWDSLRGQSAPPDEVVLVDSGSTDGTLELAQSIAATDGRVRVVAAGPASPGTSRNVGISAAANDWIALTDGGIRLDQRWLEELRRVASSEPALRVVYGHYEPVVRSFFDRCATLAYVATLHDSPGGRMRGPSIASALVHRSTWERAGAFPDFRSGEDLIFMAKLQDLGVATGWAPSAIVHWELPPTLSATFRRFRLYSRSSAQAGLQRSWQHGVATYYLAAVPFVVLAMVHSPLWAVFAAMGSAARVFRSIWRRREGRGVLWAANPVQFLGVAVITFASDIAMFVGWAEAKAGR
jgi:glycosyltransferase involved in cell wall biosynthesis